MKLKPFIYMLKTINSFYFYDVNRNDIVAITPELYNYLSRLLTDEEVIPAQEIVSQIKILTNNGYLSSNKVKEIKHPSIPNVQPFLNRKLIRLVLQVTQNCNFRCKYCVYSNDNINQRSHSNKKMSLDRAKEAIDFLKLNSIDSERLIIGFYGGEPLLEFNLIRSIVEYIEDTLSGKEVIITLTTNGSLLDDDVVRYFIKHDIFPMISLDGSQEINDKNRVYSNGNGTFNDVMKNIQHIADIYPEYFENLQISMVIDPSCDFDQINLLVKDYPMLKKIHIQTSLVDETYLNEKWIINTASYMEKENYHRFLSHLYYFKRLSEDDVSFITRDASNYLRDKIIRFSPKNGLPEVAAPSGPCIPGQLRLLVNTEGEFYPCEKISETSSAQIGSLDSGFNLEKVIELMNVAQLTSNDCINCWAFNMCGLCAKLSMDVHGLSTNARSQNCETVRANAEMDLYRLIAFQEEGFKFYNQTINEKYKENKYEQD